MELRVSTCSHVGAGPSGLRSPPPYFLSSVTVLAPVVRPPACEASALAPATALAKEKGRSRGPGSVSVVYGRTIIWVPHPWHPSAYSSSDRGSSPPLRLRTS